MTVPRAQGRRFGASDMDVARVTQWLQVNAHKNFEYIFRHPGPIHAPWQLRTVVRIPGLQRAMGRVIGMGVLPEHVRDATRPVRGPGSLCRIAVFIGKAVGVSVNAVRALKSVRAA